MPSKSEAQRRLFATALSVKRGETPKKDVTKKVLDIVNKMSEKEIEKYTKSVKEEEISEATTSASSGAYETPFGVTKKDMKKLEDLKENKLDITVEQIEKIVRRTLIREEVYSQKPSTKSKAAFNQTGEAKGKETSTKNAKNQKTYSSPAGRGTESSVTKTGETAKKANTESVNKVVQNQKNNLKDAEVVDVNKDKLQDEDQRIEAYQNGMEDITYDNISAEAQEKNTKAILNKSAMDDPNAQDTGVNQQMIDDAKKRKKSKESSKFRTAKVYGSDVEYIDGAETAQSRKLAYENTIKRLKFKESFENSKDMLKKIPKKYKENSKVFEMFDGENIYRVRWEGNSTSGVGVILEYKNDKNESNTHKRMKFLSEYDSKKHNSYTSKINESDIFKSMLDDTRKIVND